MSWKTLLTLLAVMAAAALGVAACGGDDDEDGEEAGASVSFVTPEEGFNTKDSPQSDKITAEVELEGFEIDAANVGKASEEGRGHLHFSLDGGEFDTPQYSGPNGELAKQLGVEGQYSPATEPTITYSGIPAGEHTLEVDLVNNDHSETGVSDSVTFTVE